MPAAKANLFSQHMPDHCKDDLLIKQACCPTASDVSVQPYSSTLAVEYYPFVTSKVERPDGTTSEKYPKRPGSELYIFLKAVPLKS